MNNIVKMPKSFNSLLSQYKTVTDVFVSFPWCSCLTMINGEEIKVFVCAHIDIDHGYIFIDTGKGDVTYFCETGYCGEHEYEDDPLLSMFHNNTEVILSILNKNGDTWVLHG